VRRKWKMGNRKWGNGEMEETYTSVQCPGTEIFIPKLI
jgi:hypothetical protein